MYFAEGTVTKTRGPKRDSFSGQFDVKMGYFDE
jgi:hypothetical protein